MLLRSNTSHSIDCPVTHTLQILWETGLRDPNTFCVKLQRDFRLPCIGLLFPSWHSKVIVLTPCRLEILLLTLFLRLSTTLSFGKKSWDVYSCQVISRFPGVKKEALNTERYHERILCIWIPACKDLNVWFNQMWAISMEVHTRGICYLTNTYIFHLKIDKYFKHDSLILGNQVLW